jgi:hypothetical protein
MSEKTSQEKIVADIQKTASAIADLEKKKATLVSKLKVGSVLQIDGLPYKVLAGRPLKDEAGNIRHDEDGKPLLGASYLRCMVSAAALQVLRGEA